MKSLTKIFLIFLIVHYYLVILSSYSFAAETKLGPIIGIGPWQITPGTEAETGAAFSKLASTVLGFLTALGGLATFLFLVTGALSWISSGGDKAGLEKARSQITNAVVGLVIIVAAWAIVYLIGGILGIDIVNPQNLLKQLNPKYTAPEKGPAKTIPDVNANDCRVKYDGVWKNGACYRKDL